MISSWLTQIYSLVIASPCSLNLGLKLPSACHRRAICLSIPVPSMTLKSLCPLKPSCERVTLASVLHFRRAKRNIKSTGLQGCPGRRKGLSFQGQGSLRLPPALAARSSRAGGAPVLCSVGGWHPPFPLLLESPVFLVGLRKGVERALLLRAEVAWRAVPTPRAPLRLGGGWLSTRGPGAPSRRLLPLEGQCGFGPRLWPGSPASPSEPRGLPAAHQPSSLHLCRHVLQAEDRKCGDPLSLTGGVDGGRARPAQALSLPRVVGCPCGREAGPVLRFIKTEVQADCNAGVTQVLIAWN